MNPKRLPRENTIRDQSCLFFCKLKFPVWGRILGEVVGRGTKNRTSLNSNERGDPRTAENLSTRVSSTHVNTHHPLHRAPSYFRVQLPRLPHPDERLRLSTNVLNTYLSLSLVLLLLLLLLLMLLLLLLLLLMVLLLLMLLLLLLMLLLLLLVVTQTVEHGLAGAVRVELADVTGIRVRRLRVTLRLHVIRGEPVVVPRVVGAVAVPAGYRGRDAPGVGPHRGRIRVQLPERGQGRRHDVAWVLHGDDHRRRGAGLPAVLARQVLVHVGGQARVPRQAVVRAGLAQRLQVLGEVRQRVLDVHLIVLLLTHAAVGRRQIGEETAGGVVADAVVLTVVVTLRLGAGGLVVGRVRRVDVAAGGTGGVRR